MLIITTREKLSEMVELEMGPVNVFHPRSAALAILSFHDLSSNTTTTATAAKYVMLEKKGCACNSYNKKLKHTL